MWRGEEDALDAMEGLFLRDRYDVESLPEISAADWKAYALAPGHRGRLARSIKS